jgi:hypothetical protein
MSKKAVIVRSATFLCLVATAVSLRSDVAADADKTLAGLEGISVIAAGTDKPEVTDRGVTGDWIRQTAELRLRRNGVRVLTAEESLKAPGHPGVVVTVDVKPPDAQRGLPGLFVDSIRTSFIQRVALERDPTTKALAMTWEQSSFGTVGAEKFKSGIQEGIEDEIDALSNAFLAQNPKK